MASGGGEKLPPQDFVEEEEHFSDAHPPHPNVQGQNQQPTVAVVDAKLVQSINNLTINVDTIAHRLSKLEREQSQFQPNQAPRPVVGHHSPQASPLDLATEEIQDEFDRIRDSVQNIRLQKGLKVTSDRQGIRKADQPTFNILNKCGKYTETSLKILSSISANTVTEEDIDALFKIQLAQAKYLQEELGAIYVQGNFDNTTARMYRALRKNTTSLRTRDAVEDLQHAVTIAAASVQANPRQQQQQQRPFTRRPFDNSRGRGYGGYSYHNNSQSFPTRRPPFPNRSSNNAPDREQDTS